jgi:hypothetical protein
MPFSLPPLPREVSWYLIPFRWRLEQFYEDDLADQCTVMAFRMLVKDLLVLVQAVNEGVVNLLGK